MNIISPWCSVEGYHHRRRRRHHHRRPHHHHHHHHHHHNLAHTHSHDMKIEIKTLTSDI